MRIKRLIKLLSNLEDIIVFLICLSLFLVGLYGLYDSYLVYRQANDDSILKYKPGYEGEIPEKEIVGNMVAWLTLDGTEIDYPVMQGETNNEYLNKNPYGEYSLSGSIFLDSRNSDDFSDDYSLIYGHHMENGYMFGALDEYMDEEYFYEHQTGTLMIEDTEYDITVIAAMTTLATDEYIFAPTTIGADEIRGHIKEIADVYDSDQVTDDARMIALSTCKYPDTIDRTVVIGIISK